MVAQGATSSRPLCHHLEPDGSVRSAMPRSGSFNEEALLEPEFGVEPDQEISEKILEVPFQQPLPCCVPLRTPPASTVCLYCCMVAVAQTIFPSSSCNQENLPPTPDLTRPPSHLLSSSLPPARPPSALHCARCLCVGEVGTQTCLAAAAF